MEKKFDYLILSIKILLVLILVYSSSSFGIKAYRFYMNQPGVVVKDGVQIATIIVNEAGYAPQKLELQPNMPTKIKFYADETASCSRQILSKQLDFIELVDVNEAKIIDVGKLEPGTYKYRCGMDMHKGEIVVTE